MYDYLNAMVDDIKDVSADYNWDFTKSNIAEIISDDLWNDDSVTGNASGAYTSDKEARYYVLDNMDLCSEALREFGVENATIAKMFLENNWSYFDTIIRCYLLDQAIHKFLNKY